MSTERWVIEGKRSTDKRPCWLEYCPNAEGGPRGFWSLEFPSGSTFNTVDQAEQALKVTTPGPGFWPELSAVRIRREGEVSLEGRQVVARIIREAIASDRYGYLTEGDIDVLTAYDPLRQVLVRCSACRFTTGAASVRHITDAIGAFYDGDPAHGRGLDYVRDVCLPSSDPEWGRLRRTDSEVKHQGGRPA